MFFNGVGNMGPSTDTKLYDILKVTKNSSPAEIKKSYRKLAMKYHPDRNKDNLESSEKKFKEISMAYDVLSDSEKKKKYDSFGLEGMQQMGGGGPSGGGNPFDMFSSFFREQHDETHFTSPNKKEQILVSLEDIYNNKTIIHTIKKQIICNECLGIGAKSRTALKQCNTCNGIGKVLKIMRLGPGFISQTQTMCDVCKGKGKIINPKDVCVKCNGNKVTQTYKKYNIDLKNTYSDGETIVLSEEADQFPEVSNYGDLIILLKFKDHSNFKLRNNNLIYEHTISLIDALCGSKFNIHLLDNRVLLLETEEIINPDTRKMILNEGLNSNGNLIIHFNIIFPKNKKINEDKKIYIRKLFNNINESDNKNTIMDGIKVDMLDYIDLENNTKYEQHETMDDNVIGCAQQ